jgi:ATP-binding protein involved in chromosome partitioning
MPITTEQVLDALRYVEEPDLKKDLVTLNMVRDVRVEGKDVSFTVVLTTPACPLKSLIEKACINAVVHYVDTEAKVTVNMTSDVTSRRSDDRALLPDVRNIIAVASGKGGVGKSTVAANLAVALAQSGARTGLVDADIFGPSLPLMFGAVQEKLFVQEKDGRMLMEPLEKYGVKLLSIGFLVDPGQAVPWRGPMASKALRQLLADATWGALDYLVVDLPPGTSDIHLTLVSAVPLTGAVIVTTPQEVALADARKGVAMFGMPQVNVPVLGLVENMAWFEAGAQRHYLLGKDGGKRLAGELGVPLLAAIPIDEAVSQSGDNGRPVVLDAESNSGRAFAAMARAVAQQAAIVNARSLRQPVAADAEKG